MRRAGKNEMLLINLASCLIFWTVERNKMLIVSVMQEQSLFDAQDTEVWKPARHCRRCGERSLRSTGSRNTYAQCMTSVKNEIFMHPSESASWSNINMSWCLECCFEQRKNKETSFTPLSWLLKRSYGLSFAEWGQVQCRILRDSTSITGAESLRWSLCAFKYDSFIFGPILWTEHNMAFILKMTLHEYLLEFRHSWIFNRFSTVIVTLKDVLIGNNRKIKCWNSKNYLWTQFKKKWQNCGLNRKIQYTDTC